jgi:hypothetical protein
MVGIVRLSRYEHREVWMASTGRYGPPATAEEICSTIQGLTDLEWSRIGKFAGEHLWGTDFQSPDALINETVSRLLAGSRRWPSGVAFLPCFCNAMKSIANGERELIRHDHETSASGISTPDSESGTTSNDPITSASLELDSAEACALREERRQAAAADLERIEDCFKNDDEVKWVLMGIEDGLSAADVQSISGMSKTTYETARTRLRRGRARLFRARSMP